MNNKRIIVLVLTISLMLSFSSCGNKEDVSLQQNAEAECEHEYELFDEYVDGTGLVTCKIYDPVCKKCGEWRAHNYEGGIEPCGLPFNTYLKLNGKFYDASAARPAIIDDVEFMNIDDLKTILCILSDSYDVYKTESRFTEGMILEKNYPTGLYGRSFEKIYSGNNDAVLREEESKREEVSLGVYVYSDLITVSYNEKSFAYTTSFSKWTSLKDGHYTNYLYSDKNLDGKSYDKYYYFKNYPYLSCGEAGAAIATDGMENILKSFGYNVDLYIEKLDNGQLYLCMDTLD